jgi:hypothetical protein
MLYLCHTLFYAGCILAGKKEYFSACISAGVLSPILEIRRIALHSIRNSKKAKQTFKIPFSVKRDLSINYHTA